MASKKRGLGRGLDALIGTAGQLPSDLLTIDHKTLRDVPLDQIRPGRHQPRQDFAAQALQELADSIRVQGVMQAIVLRPIENNRFEIIAGERRWRAAQLAGLETIPASVRDVTDQAAMAMALIENIQREDLNVIEEATALQRLQQEFSLTQEEIAQAVGKSRSTVSNVLRLLQLQPGVRQLLERKQLEMGHARALLGVSGGEQLELARRVSEQRLSVRQAEELVRRHLRRTDSPATMSPANRDIEHLERRLGELTGARVKISHQASGKGRLSFQYNSLEELQGLLEHFGALS